MRTRLNHVAQSVTCLTADTCQTADPGATSSMLFYTVVEIDHEIISTVVLLPFADSRRAVVSYKRKYVHGVQVNCLVKLTHVQVLYWLARTLY